MPLLLEAAKQIPDCTSGGTEQIHRTPLCSVEHNSEVLSVRNTTNGVVATVKGQNGALEEVHGGFAVTCTFFLLLVQGGFSVACTSEAQSHYSRYNPGLVRPIGVSSWLACFGDCLVCCSADAHNCFLITGDGAGSHIHTQLGIVLVCVLYSRLGLG